MDSLTARFSEGKATITNVPAGHVVVSAWRQREMLCRKDVTVAEESGAIDVTCVSQKVRLSGSVTIAGKPAGPGTIVWLTPVPSDLPTGVFTFGSGALQQQHVFTPDAAQETAEVAANGRFEGPSVFAGAWDVIWMPEGGRALGPRRITIPDVPEQRLNLDYPAVTIEGVVTDENGNRVAGAEVRDLGGRGFARTRDDGTFTLAGPDPGIWRVQARYRDRASTVVETMVTEDRERPFIELALRPVNDDIRVSVEGRMSAVVFLETDQGRIDLATTDLNGLAAFRLVPPLPQRVRVAAVTGGMWAFGDWISWTYATTDRITLKLATSGNIVVRTKSASGPVAITSMDGWRIDRLFQWLGTFLNVGTHSEVIVAGLPEGTYVLTLGNQSRTVSIERERAAEANFD